MLDLIPLPYRLALAAGALAAAYVGGRWHQHRADAAEAAVEAAETTREALRFEQHRSRNTMEVIDAYLKAKAAAQARAAAADARARSMRDDLAAARLAIDAASAADGTDDGPDAECRRLASEVAGLVGEGRELGDEAAELLGRLAPQAAALQGEIRGLRVTK